MFSHYRRHLLWFKCPHASIQRINNKIPYQTAENKVSSDIPAVRSRFYRDRLFFVLVFDYFYNEIFAAKVTSIGFLQCNRRWCFSLKYFSAFFICYQYIGPPPGVLEIGMTCVLSPMIVAHDPRTIHDEKITRKRAVCFFILAISSLTKSLNLVELSGIEPPTPWLQTRCSPS